MPNMYCPLCNKKHFIIIRIRYERLNYNGKQLVYQKRYYVCKETTGVNRSFVDGDVILKNLANIKKVIRSCE